MNADSIYITPALQKPAGDFVNSPTWHEVRRALMNRRPEVPDAKDPSHVAAAKGHRRAGYEQAITDIEKLPFETEPVVQDPFKSPALFTED